MHIALLIPEYFIWHYKISLRLCLNIVTNFVWFTYHFFSIPVLAKTFFAPWVRARGEYRSGFYWGKVSRKTFFEAGAWVGGIIARFFVLLFGTAICLCVAAIGLGLFVLWFFLPVISLGLIIQGLLLSFL